MNYIELKMIDGPAKRKDVVRVGGFELVCQNQYNNGRDIIRKGQISGDFKLEVMPDGFCKIPDTAFNRKVLLVQCFERTETFGNAEGGEGYKKVMPPVFELISNIDLKAAAPKHGQEKYSQDDIDALEAKIAALQENKQEAPVKKVVKKKVVKKASQEVSPDLEPDIA